MSADLADLPAGTTLFHCPLCEWVHAQPPLSTAEIASGLPAFDIVRNRLMPVERAIEAHLRTHELAEWLREIVRLQAEDKRLRAACAQSERDRILAERDTGMVIGMLVKRLGGSVTIHAADLAAADGTLVRFPEAHGFTLEVHS